MLSGINTSSLRGHHGSIDCVGLLNDEYFVSGGDDGAINFWSAKRKKPIVVVRNAHDGKWITGTLKGNT